MIIDITKSVCVFRSILLESWQEINSLAADDTTGSFVDDWLEANWEMIVEASIPPFFEVVLEPYGNGADCNKGSSRVWKPNLIPTTPVYIRYKGNNPILNEIDGCELTGELKLESFCTISSNWPLAAVPFDYALLDGDGIIVIKTNNLEYYVKTR